MRKLPIIMSILILFSMSHAFASCIDEGSSIRVYVSPVSVTLYHGESKQITFTIYNENSYCDVVCSYSTNTGVSGYTSRIPNGDSETHYFMIYAPSTGSGTKTITLTVDCHEGYEFGCPESHHGYCTETITLNYGPSPEELKASNDISTAESLISEAQSAISSAQSKIQEASNLGADVIQANSYLSSANTALENAQTYLSQAKNAFQSKSYSSAISYAETAQQYATQAKDYANLAKTTAEEAMKELLQKKTEASNKISAASSAIDNARKAIKEAESLINNATIIGMDTTQAEADVATARSKLKSAEDYYSEATSAFDSKNYDLAIEKASTAESYAKEAESLASYAYNSLWGVYSKKRVAAEAITGADSEVSKMREIMTKLAYILRSMKKYNVDVSEVEGVVNEAQTNTDYAEDFLSRAKNRMASGYTDEAANLAVQAKDYAASAYNRLDTIALKLKFSIQDALDAAYSEMQKNLQEAKSTVESAAQTYGVDNELLLKAQEEISNAEVNLKDAKSKIDAIETSESLTQLLASAKSAFELLEKAQAQIDKAKSDANAAKMKLYQTIAAGAAAAAGAGGGFLYWRRKKKVTSKKVEKKPKKKVEKIVKMVCKKCKREYSPSEKFCSICGRKLTKVVEEKPKKHKR